MLSTVKPPVMSCSPRSRETCDSDCPVPYFCQNERSLPPSPELNAESHSLKIFLAGVSACALQIPMLTSWTKKKMQRTRLSMIMYKRRTLYSLNDNRYRYH